MAETDLHFDVMVDSKQTLDEHFAEDSNVYVASNLLVFYVPENKRRHVAPDVFVVKGVRKKKRDNYLIWEEGKSPDAIIEITSKSTRKEDTAKKFKIYRDQMKVREYFLFDPRGDYLKPKLQGFRMSRGEYVSIAPVDGRLPSNVLALHLEDNGVELRFWDPAIGKWLPTPQERSREYTDLQREFQKLRAELDAVKRRLAK